MFRYIIIFAVETCIIFLYVIDAKKKQYKKGNKFSKTTGGLWIDGVVPFNLHNLENLAFGYKITLWHFRISRGSFICSGSTSLVISMPEGYTIFASWLPDTIYKLVLIFVRLGYWKKIIYYGNEKAYTNYFIFNNINFVNLINLLIYRT